LLKEIKSSTSEDKVFSDKSETTSSSVFTALNSGQIEK
jgi:hypothetical protein